MMKRNRGFVVILFVLPFVSLSQSVPGGFEIYGNIKGLGADSVTISVSQYDESGRRLSTDTLKTKAEKGRFRFTGTVTQPKFVWVQFGNPKLRKSASFFIEKGTIFMNGTIDSTDNISVTGTPSNNDLTEANSYANSIYQRALSLRSRIKEENEGSENYKLLTAAIESKYDSVDQYEIDFIKLHPHSFASSVFLYVKQDKLKVDELEKIFNSLDEDVRGSDMVLMIPQKIRARKSVLPGNYAPDFESVDTNGKNVRLSDFKGKYVLLEFWASWCVPCRQQSPHLVEMYRKYAVKGFTIVQYSIDDKNAAQKWKDAIVKDGLTWTQLSDLEGFDSKVTRLYGVQPIPDNFLIDPNGIIISHGLQGAALEEKLKQLLR